MEEFLAFFNEPPVTFRAGILIGGLMLFWIIEGTIPLFSNSYQRGRHAGLNIAFTVIAMILGFAMASLILLASDFTVENRFGLLYLFDLPIWLHAILGVMLLDLIGAYLVHLTEHKVKWMWKFHLIHHSDQHVDVTTGLRHHPGEILFRISFTVLGVLIAGVPMSVVMLYQTFSVLFTHITHANISLPVKVDQLISWVFVSPNMHKVHHHYKQPLTDTNFGNIFSIWDRIFGTYARVEPAKIVYGVDTHMAQNEVESFGNLLRIPFQAYRSPIDSPPKVDRNVAKTREGVPQT